MVTRFSCIWRIYQSSETRKEFLKSPIVSAVENHVSNTIQICLSDFKIAQHDEDSTKDGREKSQKLPKIFTAESRPVENLKDSGGSLEDSSLFKTDLESGAVPKTGFQATDLQKSELNQKESDKSKCANGKIDPLIGRKKQLDSLEKTSHSTHGFASQQGQTIGETPGLKASKQDSPNAGEVQDCITKEGSGIFIRYVDGLRESLTFESVKLSLRKSDGGSLEVVNMVENVTVWKFSTEALGNDLKIADFKNLEQQFLSYLIEEKGQKFFEFHLSFRLNHKMFNALADLPKIPKPLSWRHPSVIQQIFGDIFSQESERFCDLILECQGKRFYVLKSILIKASPEYFGKKFSNVLDPKSKRGSLRKTISKQSVQGNLNQWRMKLVSRSLGREKKLKTEVMEINPQLTKEALTEILYFIYLEQPSKNLAQHAEKVVRGAREYKLDSLVDHCERELISQVKASSSDAWRLLTLADAYDLRRLKMVAINVAVENMDDLLEDEMNNQSIRLTNRVKLTTEIAKEAAQRLRCTSTAG